jgi:hypothetical protein
MSLELLATIAALCNTQSGTNSWFFLHDQQVACQKDYIVCVETKQSPKAPEGVLLAACVKEQ